MIVSWHFDPSEFSTQVKPATTVPYLSFLSHVSWAKRNHPLPQVVPIEHSRVPGRRSGLDEREVEQGLVDRAIGVDVDAAEIGLDLVEHAPLGGGQRLRNIRVNAQRRLTHILDLF